MKTYLLLIAALFTMNTLFGQSIEDKEILVEKNYSNEIYQVDPLFSFRDIHLPKKEKLYFSTDSISYLDQFETQIDVSVKPVKMGTDAPESLKKGFIKADKGNLNTLSLQGAYNYIVENYYTIHGELSYDDWDDKSRTDKSIERFNAKLHGTYYIHNDLKATLSTWADRSQFGLYGAQEGSPLESMQDNTYSQFGVNLGIESFSVFPSRWNYGAQIEYTNNNSEIGNKEFDQVLSIDGNLQYKVSKTYSLTIQPEATWNFNSSETVQMINGAIYGSINNQQFALDLGVALTHDQNTTYFWPKTELRIPFSERFDLYASTDNQMSIWNIRNAYLANPYLNMASIDYSSQNRRTAEVGTRFLKWDNHEFIISVNFQDVINDLNFDQLNTTTGQFEFGYVDYKAIAVNLKWNKPIWTNQIKFSIKSGYTYFFAETSTLYNRPAFYISPGVSASILNKNLKLSLEGLIGSPPDFNSSVVQGSWRKNVSASVSYEVFDRLKVNLNADNILNDGYMIWEGYDIFGRNLSAGILVKI